VSTSTQHHQSQSQSQSFQGSASATLQSKIARLVTRLKNDVFVTRDCINVPEFPEGTQPSPATLRGLRLAAGLTKNEAASIVGLKNSGSWHQYELGRYFMPRDRFEIFADVLRSGKYPYPCFSGEKRYGTRVDKTEHVGKFIKLLHPKNKPTPARNILVREWRIALNLTARAFAELTGMDEGRIQRIHSCTASVNELELNACIRVGHERIESLKTADFTDVSIDFICNVLHFSEADVGEKMGLSRYVTKSEKNTIAFRKVALRERELQIAELLSLEAKTRQALLDMRSNAQVRQVLPV
jgi:transcriptional regulator with XRE-family HTH domain